MGPDLSSAPGWRGLSVLVVSPTPTHPQDYGNRKRIFEICNRLKRAGAQVHFLHYPSEAEWRGQVPRLADAQMRAAWDSYTIAPPIRPLHNAPKGAVHEIDEWWDPSIATQLNWIFTTRQIDVMIVNYTWLSQAFTHAPRGVYKILDTHDYFSGRKQLLETNGIAPEYFYTSREDEAAAFARADMIWAIKHDEAEIFRGMTDRPVLTMLHSEPERKLAGEATPDPDGFVRFGIVGARNNINLMNFRRFYAIARERFIESLAPVRLALVGSWTEDLAEFEDDPIIELHGRVPNLDDFYASVDAVLVPMEFSTGLKIKTGEAIAHGKPIIAHAHAFEGYPARHKFHRLKTFEAVAEACIDVSFAPAMLNDMRTASLVARRDLELEVTTALAKTVNILTEKKQPLIIACTRSICQKGALRHQYFVSNAEYFKALTNAIVFIDGEASVRDVETLRNLGVIAPVAVTPDTYARMAAGASVGALQALDIVAQSLKQLIARRRARQVLALDAIPGLADALTEDVTLYLQLDMIRAGDETAASARTLADACNSAGKVVAFTTSGSCTLREWRGLRIDELVRVPFFYSSSDLELFRRWWVATPEGGMIVTSGSEVEQKLLNLVASRFEGKLQILVASAGAAATIKDRYRDRPDTFVRTLAEFHAQPHTALLIKPMLSLDLCPEDSRLCTVREVLERNEIPTLIYGPNPLHRPIGTLEQVKRTPWKLVQAFLEALSDERQRKKLRAGQHYRFRNDEGWAFTWKAIRNG